MIRVHGCMLKRLREKGDRPLCPLEHRLKSVPPLVLADRRENEVALAIDRLAGSSKIVILGRQPDMERTHIRSSKSESAGHFVFLDLADFVLRHGETVGA